MKYVLPNLQSVFKNPFEIAPLYCTVQLNLAARIFFLSNTSIKLKAQGPNVAHRWLIQPNKKYWVKYQVFWSKEVQVKFRSQVTGVKDPFKSQVTGVKDQIKSQVTEHFKSSLKQWLESDTSLCHMTRVPPLPTDCTRFEAFHCVSPGVPANSVIRDTCGSPEDLPL